MKKSDRDKLNEARAIILGWFKEAKANNYSWINTWYEFNDIALESLKKEGILTDGFLGKIYVGIEYKGNLFVRETIDGCERLHCRGEI